MKLQAMLSMAAAALCLLLLPNPSAGQSGGAKAKAAAKAKFKLGPVTGNAIHGRKLFYDHTCYGCHGFNGETGARDLVGTDSPILANEETFILFLRQRADQAPLLPSTGMPNYPVNALSDKDARDIYAYIRSFRLDAPEINDVPTLKKILDAAKKGGAK